MGPKQNFAGPQARSPDNGTAVRRFQKADIAESNRNIRFVPISIGSVSAK
jgi:hypothetical protein